MAMSRRAPRGGPVPAAGVRAAEATRVVTPAVTSAAAERARAAMTPKRPGQVRLLQERLNTEFFREALGELRKVHWPTRQQARNFTALVIGISIAVGIILGGMDYIFTKFFEFVLRLG